MYPDLEKAEVDQMGKQKVCDLSWVYARLSSLQGSMAHTMNVTFDQSLRQ